MNSTARNYIDIIFVLIQKDLKVRYKNTLLGYLWSVGHPLAFAMAFYIAFRIVVRIQVEDYVLFLISGLFPWQWFSSSLSAAPMTFLSNTSIIKKVNFPRELLPTTMVLQDMIHFIFSIPVIVLFLVLYGKSPSPSWLYGIPVLLIIQFLMTCGFCFIIASTNLFFRDLERLTSIAVTLLFYFTPICPAPGAVTLALFWQAVQPIADDYSVSVRLEDAVGHRWSQVDGWPARGLLPTSDLAPGWVARDERTLALPEGAPGGEYRVMVYVYAAETKENLPLAAGGFALDAGRVNVPARPATSAAIQPVRRLEIDLAPGLSLLGLDPPAESVQPGGTLSPRLYWQAHSPATGAGSIRLLLEQPDGGVVAEEPYVPAIVIREVRIDWLDFAVPPETPNGTVPLDGPHRRRAHWWQRCSWKAGPGDSRRPSSLIPPAQSSTEGSHGSAGMRGRPV